MTTDWKALCAQLAENVRYLLDCVADGDSDPAAIAECVQHVGATRAFLAQPEPEGLPSDYIDSEHTGNDRELLEVFYRACLSEGGSADEIHLRGLKAVIALDQSELEGPTNEELEEFALEHGGGYFNCDCQVEADILTRKHVSNYRAVLARWGRPAVEPVPVSKRLPGEGDCDSEGRCWLASVDVEPGWVTDNPEQCTNWTHWLPHHALPLPTTTTTETP